MKHARQFAAARPVATLRQFLRSTARRARDEEIVAIQLGASTLQGPRSWIRSELARQGLSPALADRPILDRRTGA